MNIIARLIDSFSRKEVLPEVLMHYRDKLPARIIVTPGFDKDTQRWVAKIQLEKDGDTLYTEADNRDELERMVNDAVATYYEIPTHYMDHLFVGRIIYRDPELNKERKVLVSS